MKFKAFTLAELLIALAILGVIAAFTIPKVLTANQNNQHKAIVKEAAGAISEAYAVWKLRNGGVAPINTHGNDLTPFLNYLKVGDGRILDGSYGTNDSPGCSATACVFLHNGAALYFVYGAPGTTNGVTFGGNTANDYIPIWIDPDGERKNPTNTGNGGFSKMVGIMLFYNGRIKTMHDCQSGVDHYFFNGAQDAGSACFGTLSTYPPWFSWD